MTGILFDADGPLGWECACGLLHCWVEGWCHECGGERPPELTIWYAEQRVARRRRPKQPA